MTSEIADAIAKRLISLPVFYDAPPDFISGDRIVAGKYFDASGYPWSLARDSIMVSYAEYRTATNLYYAGRGFGYQYEGPIFSWNKSIIALNGSTDTNRYVTIEDLRMMAYIGSEYARAKLYGWKIRYEDGYDNSRYSHGCITRTYDGQRYICRQGGNVTAPAESGYGRRIWAPMRRTPSFSSYHITDITFPEGSEIANNPFNGTLVIGTLEGNDSLIRFIPYGDVSRTTPDNTTTQTVTSGGFSISLVPITGNTASIATSQSSFVSYQQVIYPLFRVYYTRDDMINNTKEYNLNGIEPYDTDTFIRTSLIETTSSFIPMKKGVSYQIVATFDNAVFGSNEIATKPLCSCLTIDTELHAPYAPPY